MSVIFGPVVQQGYVVPEIEPAISHWLARGVGPFFIEEHIRPPGEYMGQDMQADLSAAFAYSGDQQIEVIQQFDDGPSVYRDYLLKHPEGGLHHLAVWVDSIPEKLEELAKNGDDYEVQQRYGDAHAYLECRSHPGVMIQLMARIELMTDLFSDIEQASEGWDGKTDPIRKIDWSSGKPVLP
jgi:hypothetical protein